jgi:hypothetical protein
MKLDFRKIDWLSPRPSKERIIVGLVLLAAVAGAYALGARGGRSGPQGTQAASAPAQAAPQPGDGAPAEVQAPAGAELVANRGAHGPGPVPLQPLQSGQCRTFAPQGWRITDANRDGTVFSLASADGAMLASYAGAAVGTGQVQGFYGPQYRTPLIFAMYAVGVLTGEQAQQSAPAEQVGPYRAIRFSTSGGRQGYVLLYTFRVPDPGGYGVMMRIAVAPANDPGDVGVAGAVAAATRCTAQLHPPPGGGYHASREDHGAGSSGGGSDDVVGDYNAQLGTGWVHDDACNNYNVDVSSDWSDNGPDGGGFYKRNGNDVTKLKPGLC